MFTYLSTQYEYETIPSDLYRTCGDDAATCCIHLNKGVGYRLRHRCDADDMVTFTGIYAPVIIGSEGDNTKLFLGGNNVLYWPNATMTIGCQRAYFQLNSGLKAGDPASGINKFVLNFGDDPEATGISLTSHLPPLTSDFWYTLDGRRLSGKPAAKGIYIHDGCKVVIK